MSVDSDAADRLASENVERVGDEGGPSAREPLRGLTAHRRRHEHSADERERAERRRRDRIAAMGWDLYGLASLLNAAAVAVLLLVAMIFMLVVGR